MSFFKNAGLNKEVSRSITVPIVANNMANVVPQVANNMVYRPLVVANKAQELANRPLNHTATAKDSSTYRYREAEKRREYMREYMQRYRGK